MLTREQYMNCRTDIDDALNSSDFIIQSMICAPNLSDFQLLITKLNEIDKPVPLDDNDVSFLKRRFEPLDFPVVFKELRSYASFAFYFGKAVNVAEFHYSL